MAEYTIKMADERGRVLEQTETAASEAEVRDRFSQQGYYVYSIKSKGLLSGEINLPRRRKVRQDQFVIFNQQFLTLFHAGLPIIQALELLIKRQRNAFFRSVLQNVRDRVRGGELLSHAFEAQKVFPKVYTTTLMAGEKSGNLEEVLGRYIAFQRLAVSFRKKLISSLVYPTLLVGMLILMMVFLITFVVPQFAKLYQTLGAELPMATAVMLSIGVNAKEYFLYAVVVLGIAVFFFWRWAKSEAGSTQLDRIKLGTPLLGQIWLKYQVAVFSRMLSTLLSGGLSLVPRSRRPANQCRADSCRAAFNLAFAACVKGKACRAVWKRPKVFPQMSVEMIEVGESTGALPAMLNSISEFYEEDVQTRWHGDGAD